MALLFHLYIVLYGKESSSSHSLLEDSSQQFEGLVLLISVSPPPDALGFLYQYFLAEGGVETPAERVQDGGELPHLWLGGYHCRILLR